MIKKEFSNSAIFLIIQIYLLLFCNPINNENLAKTNFTLHTFRNLHLKVLHVPKSSDYAGRGNNLSFDSKNTHPGS